MPVITDIRIERVKRRRERLIEVDGAPAFTLTEEAFLRAGLWVGQTVTLAETSELEIADGAVRAREQALRLLNHRLRTHREIEQRLRQNQWSPSVIARAMDRLEQAGWIDDARFARLWVEERLRLRPIGIALLRRELRNKGIDEDTIDVTLQEREHQQDEAAVAYGLLQRRRRQYGGLDSQVAARRMAGYLARRGFFGETVYKAVNRLLDEMKESLS